MLVEVLLDTTIHVHYGFLILGAIEEERPGDRTDGYRGQVNGLCGAAVPGVLTMHTGLHTGRVGMRIELHTDEPELGDVWQDVVEAYFGSRSEELLLSAFDSAEGPVDLPPGFYRVRYCAQDMQRGHDVDTRPDDEPVDRYMLQFWPAVGVDRVVRQGSEVAGYRHRHSTDPALTGEELAGQVAVLRQDRDDRLAEEAEEELLAIWDGQIPDDPRLREGGWGAASLRQVDPALAQALVEADDELRRAVTVWCAERILAAAGLLDRSWTPSILAALREGTSPPNRFDVIHTLPSMPIMPGLGDDHAADQDIAVEMVFSTVETVFNAAVGTSTLATACEMCAAAREYGDSMDFTDAIRTTFGQLFR
ncbi:hypothetical protein ACQP2Y_30415 [Actinoplanes sp. CA-051413]|uniref:hypothetical protein n=1 Tax=Actinoplanes sp. CA-051413 TaxID=3239899 RepID=UPI003D99C08B